MNQVAFQIKSDELTDQINQAVNQVNKASSKITWGWILMVPSVLIAIFAVMSLVGQNLPTFQGRTDSSMGMAFCCLAFFSLTWFVGVVFLFTGYTNRKNAQVLVDTARQEKSALQKQMIYSSLNKDTHENKTDLSA